MVEPVQLREREGEGEKKPHNQTSPQHLRSPLIRGNDASRSQSFPLCLQALCKHKKHPEPINTMTTTHESAGYDRYPPHSKVRKGKKGGKEGRGQEREERQGVISVWVFFFFFSTSFWTSSDNKRKSWNGISLLFFFFLPSGLLFSLLSSGRLAQLLIYFFLWSLKKPVSIMRHRSPQWAHGRSLFIVRSHLKKLWINGPELKITMLCQHFLNTL